MHTHGSTAIRMEARGLNCTGHLYYYCRRCRRLVELERRKFMRSGTREPRDSALSSLMSLDFFFVPLATKVGASLDQVKASQEERRGAES